MDIKRDREIVRELAKQVVEIAALPEQQETKRLWKALNRLEPERPMAIMDEIPWHEMNVNDELTVLSEDFVCQMYERMLRQTLYAWKHMRLDQVVEPLVMVPISMEPFDYEDLGVPIVETTLASNEDNDVVSHHFEDQLRTEDDLEKIACPKIRINQEFTKNFVDQVSEIFDGILEVRQIGWVPWCTPWDRIAERRGAESILADLAERPEYTHKLMQKYMQAYFDLLDQCEELGIVTNDPNLANGGTYCDELPDPSEQTMFNSGKQLWTHGMAQIFSAVSPRMHKKYEIEYMKPWFERFGLVYYGCCEPLHNKINILRDIPNLRKISMSPWVDVEIGAENIGSDYVFSRKPNPAFVATPSWDAAEVEKDLRSTLESCKRHGCPTEFILKDISTVNNEPKRLWEWADIARRVVKG